MWLDSNGRKWSFVPIVVVVDVCLVSDFSIPSRGVLAAIFVILVDGVIHVGIDVVVDSR